MQIKSILDTEYIFPAEHGQFYKEFTPWQKENSNGELPKNGVYVLVAHKPIHRLIGADNEGILYIGKGIVLDTRHRIGKLINAINSTEERHDGGKRFSHEDVQKCYPIRDCEIFIKLSLDARNDESGLLKEYEKEYGELPPLNRSL